MATNAISDMLRPKESPSKSQRKVVPRIRCDMEGVFSKGLCMSGFLSEKIFLRERGRLVGSKHAVRFSTGTWHQIQIRERKRPSRGIISKCERHECSPCAPKFEGRSHKETLYQEGCARRVAWDLTKHISTSSRMRTKLPFILLLKPGHCRRPLRKDEKKKNSWSIQEHQCTSWAKKTKAQTNWILCEDPGTPLWCLQLMEKCIQTRKLKCTFTI